MRWCLRVEGESVQQSGRSNSVNRARAIPRTGNCFDKKRKENLTKHPNWYPRRLRAVLMDNGNGRKGRKFGTQPCRTSVIPIIMANDGDNNIAQKKESLRREFVCAVTVNCIWVMIHTK